MAEAIAETIAQRPRPMALRIAMKLVRVTLGLVVTSPVTVPAGILIDSAIGYETSYRGTSLTQIDNAENEQDPTYDPNSATVFMNGFGEDLSCPQARAMKPVVGRYGKIFCLTYPSIWDKVADSDKAYDAIFAGVSEDAVKHLTIFGSSLGDKRGEELGDEMAKRHDVKLEGLVMNTGAGPFGMNAVKSDIFKQHLADYTCQHAPGKATMASIQTLITEHLPGNQADPGGPIAWIKKGLEYNNSVLQNQSCTIQQPLAATSENAPDFESVFYMRPDNPWNDTIIDNLGAERDWRVIFPRLEDVAVSGGVTHDNVSYRPDAYIPVVEAVYKKMRENRLRIEAPIFRAHIR